jgi:hypothetical protein
MSHVTRFKAVLLTLILAAGTTVSAAGASSFDVTVTNLSNQILSPPVVVTHQAGASVFKAGQEASPELAALAEDADSEGLIALLGTTAGVRDVGVGDGVILPGQSMTVTVDAGGASRTFTVLGMLVTTNDSFYSARKAVRKSATFTGPAYDAGSEANTWNCAHIPGPPCGNPGVRVTNGAEGMIKISEGINSGSLRPYDWRNPVVQVRVQRAAAN